MARAPQAQSEARIRELEKEVLLRDNQIAQLRNMCLQMLKLLRQHLVGEGPRNGN
jgi:hypothetical protein